MTIWQGMLDRLTEAYARAATSRLARLLRIIGDEAEEVRDALGDVRRQRDIDAAAGDTLDRIGANVGQYRGVATDDIYRILIRSRIASNLSDGSVNTIIRVVALALSIEPSDVHVTELCPAEPAALRVDVPPDSLLAAGLSLTQFGRLVSRIAAGGVRAEVLMEGTFAFSSVIDESEEDPDAGFNGLDEHGDPLDIGGELGAVYDPADDPDLPV